MRQVNTEQPTRLAPTETMIGVVMNRDSQPSVTPFGDYACFYDALYQDKDYQAECDYLLATLARFDTRPTRTILDLGCGTGNHDLPLTRMGYEVVGVDRSEAMVAQARCKATDAALDAEFLTGDIRDLNLGRTFDAVISMFAVISYQCSNDDLLGMMRTARRHLKPGGLFVFDGWFGPAVLMSGPVAASKIVRTQDGETIERSASPVLDVLAHTVEVSYRVTRSRHGAVIDKATEAHKVRFLFPQEIALLLDLAGFDLVAMGPFMDLDGRLSGETWNVSVVSRAR